MIGYRSRQLEPHIVTWEKLIHPDDSKRVMEGLTNHLFGKSKEYRSEHRMLTAGGKWKWVLNIGMVYDWDEDGNPAKSAGIQLDIDERKHTEEALKRQSLVIEQMSDGLIITNLDGEIIDWNPGSEHMFGYKRYEVLGKTPGILHREEERERLTPEIIRSIEKNGSWNGEIHYIRKDGLEGISETKVMPLLGNGGKCIATIGVNRDIAERKKVEKALVLSEKRYRNLFMNAGVGIFRTSINGAVIIAGNHKLSEIVGISLDELLQTSANEWWAVPEMRSFFVKRLKDEGEVTDFEAEFLAVDQTTRWCLLNAKLYRDENVIEGTILDITERREMERKIRHMANHDALTGLPNRALFMDRLGVALRSAKRRMEMIAVMFIDLDGFKKVNDTLGHNRGDELLKSVSEKLLGCVRSADTVGRFGGDEFVVLLTEVNGLGKVSNIAERMIESISEELFHETGSCKIGSSIGVSFFPDDGLEGDKLLAAADRRMYSVKKSGKNGYSFEDK